MFGMVWKAAPVETNPQIVNLETMVTHLQRDVETLNQVVLDQQKQIDQFRSLLTRLDERMTRLDVPGEPFDPGLERPPHY